MKRKQASRPGIDESDVPKNAELSDDEDRPFRCRTCGNHITQFQLKCNRCMTPTGATLRSVERFRYGNQA